MEELEVEGYAGWLWGKTMAALSLDPPLDNSQCQEHPEKPPENGALEEENI